MQKIFDLLKKLLEEDAPINVSTFKNLFDQLPTDEQPRNRSIIRLTSAFQSFYSQSKYPVDLTALLRQVIRQWGSVPLHINIFNKINGSYHDFGLVHYEQTKHHDVVYIDAVPWKANSNAGRVWLPGSEDIDELKHRRNFKSVFGNGTLYKMTKSFSKPFTSYQYEGQQIAVETSLYAPPGSTTLIIIPTGGGKTMATVLPAWISSRGGNALGGTTVIVVPTVALAKDQIRNAERFFKGAGSQPRVWTGDTPRNERVEIVQALATGQLPLLFISPEGVLQPMIRDACLKAAENGYLQRFVVDEAHIVETWGAGFRPEFQYLGAFCRELNEHSNNQLRVVLLSATIPEITKEKLQTIFTLGDENLFQTITANQLRPEIAYYIVEDKLRSYHEAHIKEAIRYLPRPLIMYVTKREDAINWYNLLRHEGYVRLDVFTGDTTDADRDSILYRWNNDEIDIIIATSAFGMGVDKPDVRAVIHACIPENIDRYYQEVGRSGRDGFSSISLVCYLTPEHQEIAKGMNRSAVITTELAIKRWNILWNTRQRRNNIWVINMDAKPDHIEHEFDRTKRNRNWNHHVILLMQRARLIRVEHPLELNEENEFYELAISVVDDQAIWEAPERLEHLLDQVRQDEREQVDKNYRAMLDVLKTYSNRSKCLSYHFETSYYPVAKACGGCSSCRSNDIKPYVNDVKVRTENFRVSHEIDNNVSFHWKERTIGTDTLHIWVSHQENADEIIQIILCLLNWGHQQFILPDEFIQNHLKDNIPFLDQCARYATTPHHFLPFNRLSSQVVFPVPSAILYPEDNAKADEVFNAWTRFSRKFARSIPVTHIYDAQTYLSSEQGLFRDRINGHKEYSSDFFRWFESTERLI